MRSKHPVLSLFLFAALALFIAAPVNAQETQPGDACTVTGAFMRSGGTEIPGGHFLVCDGANWISFMDYADVGRTLFQVDSDSGACTAIKDGRIRYTSASGTPWEYCDATSWQELGSGSASAINGLSDAYTDYVSDYNFYMGDSAGSAASPGEYNIAIGQNALSSLSGTCTGPDKCNNNTALGYQALTANTTGYDNVAIGYQAGDLNTTGDANILIGFDIDAPLATTSNYLNIGDTIYGEDLYGGGDPKIGVAKYCDENLANCFVATDVGGGGGGGAINDLSDAYTDYVTDFNLYMGDSAGVASSPGQHNVAIGQDTLSSLDGTCGGVFDCNDNTAVGDSALNSNTTGYQNTASGTGALEANTTGYRNNASGRSALYSNTTGYRNNASGAYALKSNTMGYNNTASGAYALYANTTGDDNTAIGYYAGQLNTTGNGNILIGANVDAPTNSTSDHLNIGNTIYGNLSSGTIGIGQPNPNDGKLEVKGGSVCVDTNSDDSATSCISNESDIRLKKNIRAIENPFEILNGINGVYFDWRWDEFDTVKRYKVRPHDVGVIAQDVEKVLPEAMDEEIDGYKSVSYHRLTPVLIEAAKELKAENDNLKTELAEIRSKLEALEALLLQQE